MKSYRTLILYYSPDQLKKKNAFLKKYFLYKKQFKLRNVKFIKKLNKSRYQLFNISLYGYDGKLKYISNKVNSIPIILKKIDAMQLGKIEKLKLKSIELYTNAHPHTTTKGTGYKNKAIAQKSILLIKNKPKSYQFLVVNTLYQRAKYHKHQTKEMREAMKVFEKWIIKYKKSKIIKKI
jgi:hypothetical protein